MADASESEPYDGPARMQSQIIGSTASSVVIDAEARENGGVTPSHGRTMNQQKAWFLKRAAEHAAKRKVNEPKVSAVEAARAEQIASAQLSAPPAAPPPAADDTAPVAATGVVDVSDSSQSAGPPPAAAESDAADGLTEKLRELQLAGQQRRRADDGAQLHQPFAHQPEEPLEQRLAAATPRALALRGRRLRGVALAARLASQAAHPQQRHARGQESNVAQLETAARRLELASCLLSRCTLLVL